MQEHRIHQHRAGSKNRCVPINVILAREAFFQLAFRSSRTVQPHQNGRYLEVWLFYCCHGLLMVSDVLMC